MPNLYTISKKDLLDLLSRLADDYSVLVPYLKGERLDFGPFDPEKADQIELGGIRQTQPVKSFFIPSRQAVIGGAEKPQKPAVVAGVKACDLKSLKIQDYVFKGGDLEDPFYINSREGTVIISCDCTYAKETCFCLAMECSPYPAEGFDINLSPLGDHLLAEIATDKGRAILNKYRMFFRDAPPHDVDSRDKNRRVVSNRVRELIDRRSTPDSSHLDGAVRKNYNSAIWQEFSSTCVECGACNLVCPTCHCFLLLDEKRKDDARRLKLWDSCLYKSFARVAGGANPRRHLHERLKNRFDKKFAFFPQVTNTYACTGCGRCIEACPGDIDIREVLKGLVKGSWNKPPNE